MSLFNQLQKETETKLNILNNEIKYIINDDKKFKKT